MPKFYTTSVYQTETNISFKVMREKISSVHYKQEKLFKKQASYVTYMQKVQRMCILPDITLRLCLAFGDGNIVVVEPI